MLEKISPKLPPAVLLFGAVSFLNDSASEMITPLLPLFLTTTLGAGPAVVGFVEGLAEATASVLKLIAGRLADRGWGHKRFVLGGYSLSNLCRPLIGLAASWPVVLLLRFLDRVGKGLRTSPRDALIAAAADSSIRGKAFGFHRAMDHAGAMAGPIIAFALLSSGMSLRSVFLVSVIPGIMLVALLWRRLPATAAPAAAQSAAPVSFRWRGLDRRLRGLVLTAAAWTFASVPDVFLVLWAAARGVETALVPVLWAVAHGGRALVAALCGSLSDRLGRFPVVVTGWLVRAVMLLLLGLLPVSLPGAWLLFIAYIALAGFTEGAERALIADASAQEQRGTAFGLYHMLSGLAALPGAVVFGAIWQGFGMSAAFIIAALLSAAATAALIAVVRAGWSQRSTRS